MSKTRKDRLLAACGAAALMMGNAPAFAADPSPPAKSASPGLEEIVVVARRYAEKSQSVPIAITAFTPQDLKKQGVENVGDLQHAVPSLTSQEAISRNFFRPVIRGQTSTLGSDLPGVDVLFAETPVNRPSSASQFFDISDVQVLKGPQGVAFGRNTQGGAILITPRQPTYTFGGSLSAAYGNFNYQDYTGVLNLPIVKDKLAVRLGFQSTTRDGLTENIFDGTKLDDIDNHTFRASILFEPTLWLKNVTIADYNIDWTNGTGEHITAINPTLAAVGTLIVPPSTIVFVPLPQRLAAYQENVQLGPDKVRAFPNGYNKFKTLLVRNTTTIELGDNVTFKNIIGYEGDYGTSASSQYDGTLINGVITNAFNAPSHPIRQITNESQVHVTGMDGRFNWVTGFFYLRRDYLQHFGPNQALAFQVGTPAITLLSDLNTYFQSYAPYSHATVPLDFVVPGLSFNAGVRWTYDHRAAYILNGIQVLPGFIIGGLTGGALTADVSGQWSGFNWEVGVDYKATDKILLYVVSRHGFKGGQFNATPPTPAQLIVNPENVQDVEVGMKSDWLIGGQVPARLNIDFWHQWVEDLVRQKNASNGLGIYNVNGGTGIVHGIEVEASIQPFDFLTLNASYSFTEADLTVAPGIAPTIKDLPDVPKQTVNGLVTIKLPIDPSLGELFLDGKVYYQTKKYPDQSATSAQSVIPGYTLLDADLTWRGVAGSPVDVSLFAKNITDEVYSLGGLDFYDNTGGFVSALYGEPRTYGIRASYAFGGEAR